MGVDGLDVLEPCSLGSQQLVVHTHAGAAYYVHVISYQQVINLIDRTCGGVLDGQYAVFAQAVGYHSDNALKGVVEHNLGHLKEFFGGNLGVCALTSLTGHYGALGERGGIGIDQTRYGLVEW